MYIIVFPVFSVLVPCVQFDKSTFVVQEGSTANIKYQAFNIPEGVIPPEPSVGKTVIIKITSHLPLLKTHQ